MVRLALGGGGPRSVVGEVASMLIGLDPEQETDAIRRAMFDAREHYRDFMRLMYPYYLEGAHITLLREKLEAVERGDIRRLIVTMPPRHSKSLHVSESFPAWYLGRNPDNRVIAVSHTQDLAEKMSYRVRQKFFDPNWPFPMVRISRDRGGVKQWDLEQSPTGGYVAVGVGGSPVGLGGDLIIIDDPIKSQADASSALIRERLWDWYSGTLYTRRQPGAAIIVTATRWHEDDLTGRLLQKMDDGGEAWEELHLPAQFADGSYLWPEFWSVEEYEKAKAAADFVWLAQYQGRPSREGGNLLREEWFPDVVPGELVTGLVQTWDCAEKPGITNDYSVCATLAITPTGYDLIHLWRDRVGFPDLEQAARDQASWITGLYPNVPYTLGIEDKSAGTQLIQTLRAETSLPVVEIAAATADNKVQRVIRNTSICRARRVRILARASWRSDFMREIKGFPNEAHDDIVDAVMMAIDEATGADAFAAASRSYTDRARERAEQDNRRDRRVAALR